jgi:nitroreductase
MDMHPASLTDGKDRALAARYGADAVPPVGPWNDTIALLLSHRSVRAYRPDPVPEGTLATLVAAAQSAATSSNLQTWSVVSVTDPAVRAALARIANGQKHIEQCPLFLVWLADLSRLARLGEAEGVAMEALPYLETFLVAAIDAALAAQNAVTAAESLGLSTVYIGALRNHPREVAALLGLPPMVLGVFGLCVGYAKPEAAAEVKPRLPQSLVLHHGRYGVPAEEEQATRRDYDATMLDFSRRNGMGEVDWSKRAINRAGTVKALSGRHTLRETLDAMGFPLK